MARLSLAYLLRLALVSVLWASLSGCFLNLLTGNTTSDGGPGSNAATGPGSKPDDIAETSSLSASVSAAKCGTTATGLNCVYNIDGEHEDSTIDIISVSVSGQPSPSQTLIDPLILEVPAGVISTTGTYDSGSGPHPLLINRANSFPVQPGMRITAEVGTTFLFLEVPASVTSGLPISNPAAGPVLTYTLGFMQNVPLGPPPPPVTVKPMMAGAVTILWQTYFVPLLPCVTDFASIPAVTIPQSSTPQNLATRLGDILRSHSVGPCNHVTYDFTQAQRPPGLQFLPLALR